MTPNGATHPGYRFPREIISHAVWLHHVFGLSDLCGHRVIAAGMVKLP